MPSHGHPVEYRVVLLRNGPPRGMFDAPGFSLLIQASEPEEALTHAEQLAKALNDHFRIVDVYPADRIAGPARP